MDCKEKELKVVFHFGKDKEWKEQVSYGDAEIILQGYYEYEKDGEDRHKIKIFLVRVLRNGKGKLEELLNFNDVIGEDYECSDDIYNLLKESGIVNEESGILKYDSNGLCGIQSLKISVFWELFLDIIFELKGLEKNEMYKMYKKILLASCSSYCDALAFIRFVERKEHRVLGLLASLFKVLTEKSWGEGEIPKEDICKFFKEVFLSKYDLQKIAKIIAKMFKLFFDDEIPKEEVDKVIEVVFGSVKEEGYKSVIALLLMELIFKEYTWISSLKNYAGEYKHLVKEALYVHKLAFLLERKELPSQLVLYGPPGTGKTYLSKQTALYIIVKVGEFEKIKEHYLNYVLDKLRKYLAGFPLGIDNIKNKIERVLSKIEFSNGELAFDDEDLEECEKLILDELFNRLTTLEEKEWLGSVASNLKDLKEGEIKKISLKRIKAVGRIVNEIGLIRTVQFHPSYSYEDFIRGIQVDVENGMIKYKTVNKIFADLCDKAKRYEGLPTILIIDEINRGNLPHIFGELIYALEYRDEPVETVYSINGSSMIKVPKNLYVIATMNTADRSVSHIDYAIRRRFTFYPVNAESSFIENEAAKRFYEEVIDRIFDSEEGCLTYNFKESSDDVKIGHTYFLVDDKVSLINKILFQVFPLLREYVIDGILKRECVDKVISEFLGIEFSILGLDICSYEIADKLQRSLDRD